MDSIRQAIVLWENQIDVQDIGLAEAWQVSGAFWEGWETMNLPIPWEYATLPGVDGVVWFKKRRTDYRTFIVPLSLSLTPSTTRISPISMALKWGKPSRRSMKTGCMR
ncbi:MAG: hypothetical protein H6573_00715 [Lewinellaceae bacterium]|nr:hypothetical protein [Lewinellaceae bacterium]